MDALLETRLTEFIVHCDDLSLSVGRPMPEFPREAYDISIATLIDIARRFRGDLAVVRAMTRRERDDVDALRVL